MPSGLLIEILEEWDDEELLAYLRPLLPHFFQYIDTLPPRQDRKRHWYFCYKQNKNLVLSDSAVNDGETASLVRCRSGAHGHKFYLFIGKHDFQQT